MVPEQVVLVVQVMLKVIMVDVVHKVAVVQCLAEVGQMVCGLKVQHNIMLMVVT